MTQDSKRWLRIELTSRFGGGDSNEAQGVAGTRRRTKARQPKRPLSGLLRRESCGRGMSSVGATKGATRVQCSTHRESGACDNGRKLPLDAIEATVFAGLRDELLHPEAIADYVKVYNAERRQLAKSNSDQLSKFARRAPKSAASWNVSSTPSPVA